MLTLQQIKENPELTIERLAVKGFDGKEAISRVIDLDNRRRELQLNNDNMGAELKKLASEIGALMKKGEKDAAEKAKTAVAELKNSQKEIADQLDATENEIREILLSVPNLPCAAVPA
nr:serine--tRNA ligase [Muribaculaceae bacterium]